MGYEPKNSKRISELLMKVDEKLRKPLQDLICVPGLKPGTQNQTPKRQIDVLNEGKEIYVNEPGLYQLIMMSRLKSA